ncbi:MAG: PQQ-dependent sugar dehydrogenase [Myxococcota bacterium]|nr:PQQ-dependent sugar dehydrogenase [Myxococcota bacterium]
MKSTLVSGLFSLFTTACLVGCTATADQSATFLVPASQAAVKLASPSDVPLRLVPWLEGLRQPTDIQRVPGAPTATVILQKKGQAIWYDELTKTTKPWFDLEVLVRSEQGLLGIAFHPAFATNGRFFLNYSTSKAGKKYTRIAEWHCSGCGKMPGLATQTRVVLDVEQPWPNHNAGQLQFGPDGMLYVGLGDGGAADDPRGHGQNTKTLLGSMLRLDVSQSPYRIPADNPFVKDPMVRSEIWAYGLRNPWRYEFLPNGSLITGDVGQNRWEKISLVPRGGNLGWNAVEGPACFAQQAPCAKKGFVEPLFSYDHEQGQSVTGGVFYHGQRLKTLANHYLFGDFVSGHIWKMSFNGQLVRAVKSLGRWPISPSCFGRDMAGEILVADFNSGTIYRFESGQ